MQCRQQKNKNMCNCSYEPCSRKGICCECLQYHLKQRQLPACCFPNDVETTFDRSFEKFIQVYSRR
ncbi:hypothetical protein J7L67_10535 [bacterium]|nr:hypothetical protein [bacterium]